MSVTNCPSTSRMLLRRGLALEFLPLSGNVVGAVVLLILAVAAGSVALATFGVDSMIEFVAAGSWWAGPLSALVILVYGLREARHAWLEGG